MHWPINPQIKIYVLTARMTFKTKIKRLKYIYSIFNNIMQSNELAFALKMLASFLAGCSLTLMVIGFVGFIYSDKNDKFQLKTT